MEPKIKPITPRPLAGGDFGNAFFRYLQDVEGRVERVHTDNKGIPTLGVGTALAVRGKDGKFHLREDLDKRIGQATEGRHQLTPGERQRLQDTVKAINAGDLAKAKELIPPFSKMEEGNQDLKQANNKFGFIASEKGVKAAAQTDMNEARQSAWNDVKQAARDAGWSDSQIADYKTKFENSKEMVGLASVKYNTGPGEKLPETAKAIVAGDRARAVYEIEMRTNKGKDKGIANRRVNEASFLRHGMSDADDKILEKIVRKNPEEVADYAKRHPDAFGKSSAAGMLKPGGDPGFSNNGPTGQDDGSDDDDQSGDGPGFGNNGPTGQDDDADDDSPSGYGPSDSSTDEGQPQSTNVTDPEAPSETLELKLGPDGEPITKEITPEQRNLIDDFEKSDGPLDEILAKNPRDWTQGEFVEVKNEMINLPAGQEQERLDAMATEFIEHKFGGGSAKYDAVGRMMDPEPIRPINQKPVPARTHDGEPLIGAVSKIGNVVAEAAGAEGSSSAVQGLQSGLNLLKQVMARSAKSSRPKAPGPDLKTDGVVGPKTRRALRFATANLGRPKIKEGFALGRFGRFASDVQTGRDDTRKLGTTIDKSFGPLFRPLGTSLPKAGRAENAAFQATLNDLGPRVFERDVFKPIREDGLIGPRTETSFNAVLPAAGADRFTSRLGHNLGFFDFDDFG